MSFRGQSLKDYYENLFTMTHSYNFSITDLNEMIPWERDVYIDKINRWVASESEKIKQKQIESQQDMGRILKMNRKRK